MCTGMKAYDHGSEHEYDNGQDDDHEDVVQPDCGQLENLAWRARTA